MLANKLGLIEVLLLFLFISSGRREIHAKENQGDNKQQNQQPLANIDKLLRQNNGLRLDSFTDGPMASSLSKAFTESLSGFRRIFEDKKVVAQFQENVQRVQNTTGVNATNLITNLQKQASSSNLTNLTNNVNLTNIASRLQNP